MNTLSISQLEELFTEPNCSPPKAIRLAMLRYEEHYYESFINLISEYLEEIFANLNHSRKQLSKDTEDRLTVEVVNSLRLSGFDATHDTQTGGHCDIYVQFKCAEWVGEAKKIKSNEQANIKKGLLQLTERYASGIKYKTQGAIIIYCFAPNAQTVLDDLAEQLSNDNYKVEQRIHENDLHFKASKKHKGTGNTYHVTSYIVPLYHNPPV